MNIRIYILTFFYLGTVSCGEAPTSHLSEEFPIIRSGPLEMDFALIPSGTFRMGSPEGEEGRYNNERIHWVKLTEDYWMQTTEVTIGQWYKVMENYPDGNGKCWESNVVIKENHYPIACVNVREIKVFVDKLNNLEKSSGYEYSLPTEAQWEYAARAYTETPYSVEDVAESFAWYEDNSGGHSHPVGELKPNFFGLYDVHGNVNEWVSDWYEDYPKMDSYLDAVINPEGPDNGSDRILRGGDWINGAAYSRSAFRFGSSVSSSGANVGFRLLRTNI